MSGIFHALQNAGAVIGKGGANIKRLRQDVSDTILLIQQFHHV